VVAKPDEAEMLLELMEENTDKRILSLSGGGKVREFELVYRVTLRMRSAASELWSEPQTIELRRDFSYSDSELLAKEGEEARLYSSMRSDATREIMRRLSVQQAGVPAAQP
jgi:LPS-assembly lipoprotein